MDAYWDKFLAVRERIPTASDVARHASYRFTKYSHEQIFTAAIELADANDAAVRAYAAACEFIDSRVPKEDQQYPGWERYVDAPVAAVLTARWKYFDNTGPQFGMSLFGGSGIREVYPLSVWAQKTKAFQRAAHNLQKVIDSQLSIA